MNVRGSYPRSASEFEGCPATESLSVAPDDLARAAWFHRLRHGEWPNLVVVVWENAELMEAHANTEFRCGRDIFMDDLQVDCMGQEVRLTANHFTYRPEEWFESPATWVRVVRVPSPTPRRGVPHWPVSGNPYSPYVQHANQQLNKAKTVPPPSQAPSGRNQSFIGRMGAMIRRMNAGEENWWDKDFDETAFSQSV